MIEETGKKDNEVQVEELLANTETADATNEVAEDKKSKKASSNDTVAPLCDDSNKLFQKFKIKDIVFLAIMSAVMLVTGAIMPLVGQIPLFGIIQLALGLQFSIFPVIGMMKVRKPGSLMLMSLFCGIMLVFMNTIMFLTMLVCALIAEALSLLIFKGYKNDWSCVLAGTVYFPTTLPFLYVWYKFIYTWEGDEGEAVSAFIGSGAGTAIGMSIAVVALCFVGSIIGMLISRELKKSGVMKK